MRSYSAPRGTVGYLIGWIDAVLGKQKIARILARLRMTHHHRHDVRIACHHRQTE